MNVNAFERTYEGIRALFSSYVPMNLWFWTVVTAVFAGQVLDSERDF